MNYSLFFTTLLVLIWQQISCGDCRRVFVNVPGPFKDGTFNIVLYILLIFIIVLVLLLVCCVCCCLCCGRGADDSLAVTPSELIEIGATPSDLKAANISPKVLKDVGANYKQMAALGATPSQLVEAGAGKDDLQVAGATPSQIDKVFTNNQKQLSTKPMASEIKPKMTSQVKNKAPTSVAFKPDPSAVKSNVKPETPPKLSKMSETVQSMAQKINKNPRKTSPKEKPKPAPAPEAVASTVSTSPQKKAAALAPTDDSMSVAMGPTSKS